MVSVVYNDWFGDDPKTFSEGDKSVCGLRQRATISSTFSRYSHVMEVANYREKTFKKETYRLQLMRGCTCILVHSGSFTPFEVNIIPLAHHSHR